MKFPCSERRVLVSELSGRSNIVAMTTKYNIEHDKKLMDKILAKVVSKEHAGYQFEAADATFNLLFQRCLPHSRNMVDQSHQADGCE